ncbi:uncharacterized protein LOC108087411 [Drosophila ficusphila]|uniref:uncharacterized protein LOC108087411 n=1 Tax=Drosophila ficusphila TaxID=30025 RepID=UPI0007E6DFF5|nr:uncharacterized protein LOC108087411 [Drosophila ficusphila]
MERYNRVYRDPGSPLAPLTPLNAEAFSFDDVMPAGGACKKNSGRSGPSGNPRAFLSIPTRRPTRFSKEFMRTRSVFSPNSQSTLHGESSLEITPKLKSQSRSSSENRMQQETRLRQEVTRLRSATLKMKSERSKAKSEASRKSETPKSPMPSIIHPRYKAVSPVEHPTLSPRVKSLLSRTGNEHLTEMFTREEIDLEVLIQMTLEDLAALGVRGAREIRLAMNIIQLAKQIF